MSSLHHSRGRILFDAACAFGVSASCVLAWNETYAPAMLPVAGIAGLYGLVRILDMKGDDRAAAAVVEPVVEPEMPAVATEWPPVAEPLPEPAATLDEALAKVKAKPGRKPPKAKAGRAKKEPASELTQAIIEPAPVELVVATEPEPVASPVALELEALELAAEPEVDPAPVVVPITGLEPASDPTPDSLEPDDDEAGYPPAPIAPLFETDPFRNRRAGFGRKAG